MEEKLETQVFVHETYGQKHIPSGFGQQYGKAQRSARYNQEAWTR